MQCVQFPNLSLLMLMAIIYMWVMASWLPVKCLCDGSFSWWSDIHTVFIWFMIQFSWPRNQWRVGCFHWWFSLRCVLHWSVKGNLENSVSNHTIDITLKLTLKCYFENSKCHSSSNPCKLWTYHRCSWNPDFKLLVATVISLFSLFYIKVLIDSS